MTVDLFYFVTQRWVLHQISSDKNLVTDTFRFEIQPMNHIWFKLICHWTRSKQTTHLFVPLHCVNHIIRQKTRFWWDKNWHISYENFLAVSRYLFGKNIQIKRDITHHLSSLHLILENESFYFSTESLLESWERKRVWLGGRKYNVVRNKGLSPLTTFTYWVYFRSNEKKIFVHIIQTSQ